MVLIHLLMKKNEIAFLPFHRRELTFESCFNCWCFGETERSRRHPVFLPLERLEAAWLVAMGPVIPDNERAGYLRAPLVGTFCQLGSGVHRNGCLMEHRRFPATSVHPLYLSWVFVYTTASHFILPRNPRWERAACRLGYIYMACHIHRYVRYMYTPGYIFRSLPVLAEPFGHLPTR